MARALRVALPILGAALVALTAVHAWPAGGDTSRETGGGGAPPWVGTLIEDESVQIDVHPGDSNFHGRVDDGWRQVARGFASDFGSHDGDDAAWLERISRWTTPWLAESYRHTDGRLLATGPPKSLEVVAAGLGVVQVVCAFPNGSTISFRLEVTTPGNWAVAAVEP